MCLIVVKPVGMKMPSNRQLNYWRGTHPDGFGLAFPYQGKVRILKGAMDNKEMFCLLDKAKKCLGKTKLKDVNILFHFRQATHGLITPGNCHPFPVTNSPEALVALDVITDCAVAHNGIISGYDTNTYAQTDGVWHFAPSNISDTQEFIKEYLVPLGEVVWHPTVQRLIEACTNSLFALLSSNRVDYIGKFENERGCYYSNGGYKKAKPKIFTYFRHFGAKDKFLGYEELNKECFEQGGSNMCDLCQNPAPLYEMPNDGSLLCASCFTYFVGREPEAEERAYV